MTPDELEARCQDVLAEVFQAEGCMLSRFVLAAEVIEADGARVVWNCTSEDLTRWDSLGLLDYALSMERANILADRLNEDPDDEV